MRLYIVFFVIKLKKIIVYLLTVTLVLCLCTTGHTKDHKVKVPIIMYHSILKSNPQNSNYIVNPSTLESDLIYLKHNGYETITVKDLTAYVYDGKPLPKKPVMLTFDDGHYNNMYYAYPLMKKYNMKMVISVVGEYTDKFSDGEHSNPNYSYLTWEQIAELQNSGYVEIQNHTYAMHSITKERAGSMKAKYETKKQYQNELSKDLLKLQNKLKETTGTSPTAFTYPFGKISNDSAEIVKSLGFKASFSCAEGISEISKNPESLYMLKRYIRPPNIDSKEYFDKILH